MLTLALDCSTARGSVALATANDDFPPTHPPLWTAQFTAGRGHGGELFTALRTALDHARRTDAPLVQILVGLGPGSYSGVRQAIAAAVGLSVSTGAALHGVPSPAALETDAPSYHAVGDARRGAYYYTAVENHRPLDPGPVLLPDRAALDARLALRPSWPILAVETAADLLPATALPALPHAAGLLVLPPAARTPAPLEPIYLRPVAFTLPKPKEEVRMQNSKVSNRKPHEL